MKFDWSLICDHIYCLNYKPYADRKVSMEKELKLIGMLPSENFEWWHSEPNVMYDCLFSNLLALGKIERFEPAKPKCGTFLNEKVFNLMVYQLKLLQDAYDKGYGKILLMEDDIVFMKDKRKLKKMLNAIPKDYDIVNLDYWLLALDDGKTHQQLIDQKKINDFFVDSSETELVNASCVLLSRKAIEHILHKQIEDHLMVADYWLSWHPDVQKDDLKRAIPVKNLAVQNVCNTSNNCQSFHANQWRYNKSHRLDLYEYDSYVKPEVMQSSQVKSVALPKMKTALVCIAKNEDHYIEEWIDYHLSIGFDDIWVYKHYWKFEPTKKYGKNVHWIDASEFAENNQKCQDVVYNKFFKDHAAEYDWAMFLDVDEFLNLKNKDFNNNVKTFFSRFESADSIAICWRFFGSGAQKFNGEYSVLKRFTRCSSFIHNTVKSAYNCKSILKKLEGKPTPCLVGVHSISDKRTFVTVDATGSRLQPNGSKNTGELIDSKRLNDMCHVYLATAYVNHYQVKTFEEFKVKYDNHKIWNTHSIGLYGKLWQKAPEKSFEILDAYWKNDDNDNSLKDYAKSHGI